MGLEGRGGGGEEEGKKHSRLNQKERRLTKFNAGYDTFKSTEALPRLILHTKAIYGVKICEGKTEEGHKRES